MKKRFKSIHIKCRFCFLIVLSSAVLIFPRIVMGQLNARSLGLGGAYTALARGIHAADWNPANLGLPDNPKFSFTFISASVRVNNNSFTKGMYDKYLVDKADDNNSVYWSKSDISDILNTIPADGLLLNMSARIRTMSFSIGRFALAISSDIGANFNLARSLLEIPLNGTAVNKKYSLDDVEGTGLGFGAISMSWGQPIQVAFAEHFSIGATLRAFYGGGYGKTDTLKANIDLKSYGVNIDGLFDATYAYNSGRAGWGLDIGTAAMLDERWTVSLALSNITSSIPWVKNIKQIHGVFHGDSLNVMTNLKNDLSDSTWTEDSGTFISSLPPVLRAGAVYREGRVLIALDYYQGFGNGAFSDTKPRFAIGTEWSGISWLPLRAGVVLGGRIGFGTSFGLGFHPGGFRFDLAFMNIGGLTPQSSKGIGVGFDLGMDLDPGER